MPHSRILRSVGLVLLALLALWNVLTCFIPVERPNDYDAFLASGAALSSGESPYALFTDRLNLNPPIWLPLFVALSRFGVTFDAWRLLSLALYIITLVALRRAFPEAVSPTRLLAGLALLALPLTLHQGQVYILLTMLVAGAWIAMDRDRPLWVGACIGLLCALKPNFLVWPALLFLAGYRREALVSGAVFALASALPLALYGTAPSLDWLRFAAHPAATHPANVSISGVLARWGLRPPGLAIAVPLLVPVALWAWHRRPAPNTVAIVAVSVSLLASPVAWIGYSIVLLPVLVAMPRLPWPALLILLAPTPLVRLSGWESYTVAWLYLAAAVIIPRFIPSAPPTPGAPPCAAATPPGPLSLPRG